MSLFSFQGKVYAGERLSSGKLSKPIWMGNVPTMTLQMSTESTNKTESFSGNRLQYGRLQRGKTATLNLTFDEFLPQNVALALWATELSVTTGTASAEVFETGLAVGDHVKLDNPFVSSVVVTDAAGSPATLVEDTDYEIVSANSGLIKILDLGAYTQPFEAAYSFGARDSFTMFTNAPPERYILLDGINTETNEPVVVTLYRCKFDPVSDLGLINDEYGQFQLAGSVLYDTVNAADANLGGFGRIDLQAA
ncbi:MAG: hypothetical protein GY942_26855 [Aestuariibacter sp.]|nr:hypothetical protein [Halieaceae bacterium]MCP5013604.1 hypothetical protein [Aestuariibacter sp.]